jgi:hypothetical protein
MIQQEPDQQHGRDARTVHALEKQRRRLGLAFNLRALRLNRIINSATLSILRASSA